MAAIRTALLLVHLALAASAWENLPAIPAGRRAEYFLLQHDGGYKYGYDTGEGQSALVHADPANEVQGSYSYLDKAGQKVSLAYTAGEGGFMPVQDGRHPGGAGGVPVASRSGGGGGDFVDADYDANADASYAFDIDTDSYKRTESSDARGNIRGQYSYNSREGGSQSLSYVAGEGTGFVVTGGTAGTHGDPGATGGAYIGPRATPYSGPAANTNSNMNPDGSYSFSFGTADQSREESADAQNNVRGSYSFRAKDDGQTRRVDYQAGAATGFVASGAHLPVAPIAGSPVPQAGPYSAGFPAGGQDEGPSGDASYSYGFDLADQSRKEASDSQGNIRGSFAFVAPDGVHRQVDYEAGAEKGFIAKGAHLPMAPMVPGGGDLSGGYPGPVSTYTAGASAPGVNPDGSYSFSYNSADQSRQESADAQNNVRGSFSFTAPDDGLTRRVDYEAGAATGFLARGAHLPVAPSVPGSAPGSYPSPYSARSSPSQTNINPDGSYSFSYNTADQSRQESGDSQNNVRGSFSFKAPDDGQTRRVDYEAGAATGFIARGAHLPVAPAGSPGASQYSSAPYSGSGSSSGPYSGSGSSSGPYSGSGSSAGPYSGSGSSAGPYSGSGSSAGPAGDGSYSFSYNGDGSSRQESGDSQGKVRGSFSFKAPDDGQTRRVDYEAGPDTGFLATGAHLPVPPVPAGGHMAPAHAKAHHLHTSGFTVHKYLPPDSPHKFGYVFDTKV